MNGNYRNGLVSLNQKKTIEHFSPLEGLFGKSHGVEERKELSTAQRATTSEASAISELGFVVLSSRLLL